MYDVNLDVRRGQHMAIIVQKYGGSSVSDLTKIRAVAERDDNGRYLTCFADEEIVT